MILLYIIMKVCCIIYHSKIFTTYKEDWVLECIKSIYLQTYKKYDIIELCYDESDNSLIKMFKEKGIFKTNRLIFLNKKMKNNIEAENYIFNYAFNKLNYDVCININIDDIYNNKRFELQMKKIEDGYDIVSSNYKIFQNYEGEKYEREMKIVTNFEDEYEERLFYCKMIIDKKVTIPFSCFTFTKKAWNLVKKVIYPESLYLCQKILSKEVKIHTCDQILLYHRIHSKQYSNIYKNEVI
tara:strand:- start:5194 stop:5913 length:720 start_codon:yes stop_codon:yes gene_type:complete